MSRYWRRARRIITHHVLHTEDSPNAIARGAAVATFIAFLPLVGIQTILALAVAALLRANKAVCIPVVWITNPFTIVPIYGACFAVGRFLTGMRNSPEDAALLATLEQPAEATEMLNPGFWQTTITRLLNIGGELWVGCVVLGVIAAVPAYLLTRWGVIVYRERRRRRVLRRSLFLASRSPRAHTVIRSHKMSRHAGIGG